MSKNDKIADIKLISYFTITMQCCNIVESELAGFVENKFPSDQHKFR